ncbi:SAM-dependent methyltransferase [Babesia caballi]|uniref:SAM-dependent methyltransferase n=1 Tax=Babesia caballi TaxID=5871 RepID=A0AAV4LTW6_BABCB|nr:SAM-dependent methyltransferase [Babesia caballi]
MVNVTLITHLGNGQQTGRDALDVGSAAKHVPKRLVHRLVVEAVEGHHVLHAEIHRREGVALAAQTIQKVTQELALRLLLEQVDALRPRADDAAAPEYEQLRRLRVGRGQGGLHGVEQREVVLARVGACDAGEGDCVDLQVGVKGEEVGAAIGAEDAAHDPLQYGSSSQLHGADEGVGWSVRGRVHGHGLLAPLRDRLRRLGHEPAPQEFQQRHQPAPRQDALPEEECGLAGHVVGDAADGEGAHHRHVLGAGRGHLGVCPHVGEGRKYGEVLATSLPGGPRPAAVAVHGGELGHVPLVVEHGRLERAAQDVHALRYDRLAAARGEVVEHGVEHQGDVHKGEHHGFLVEHLGNAAQQTPAVLGNHRTLARSRQHQG